MRKFSQVIKELRGGKYTQQELADKLGVSKSTIAMWETDKRLPSTELYEHIADLFNVDIDYLYGRTDVKRKIMFDEHGDEYVNSNHYLNEETRKLAQELFENRGMRMLMDAARDIDEDTLKAYAKFLQGLKEREEGRD